VLIGIVTSPVSAPLTRASETVEAGIITKRWRCESASGQWTSPAAPAQPAHLQTAPFRRTGQRAQPTPIGGRGRRVAAVGERELAIGTADARIRGNPEALLGAVALLLREDASVHNDRIGASDTLACGESVTASTREMLPMSRMQ
jgi:hypothetical protein